ncbi:hypothetical protein ETD86_11020 [Nonomuraea turkmeniaca]|uniref:Uncharacterized protein n=1 Tax=Nonomuraea turkmeniaca TaxID=103838 RepID=A0A5S4FPB3_9ACTN|nr:hypothetical protein [Nonomuraea turkmeniaca]TMR22526.1 hypothetical protein ETD86_11020 [Nonomuraea turkmeniaca]
MQPGPRDHLAQGPRLRRRSLHYALFALVVLHAFAYGALLRMTCPFTVLLAVIVMDQEVRQVLGAPLLFAVAGPQGRRCKRF